MLKGIGVTWTPKSKKVKFVKHSGEKVNRDELVEALNYCQWRFGYRHKDYSQDGSTLTVGM